MLNKLDLKNKKVYLAPKNNITRLLSARLIKQSNIEFLGYIDTYSQDNDIISIPQLKEYDYLFIYSPNYYLDIIKQLPQKNLYVIYNNKYDFVANPNIITKYLPSILYQLERYSKRLFLYKEKIPFTIKEKFNISINQNIKNIDNLKKIDKRVFIIGNGPSLKISDLDMLKDEITIGANKIFLAFNETKWRPTYYTIEDSLDLEEYYNEIEKYNLGIKFFPIKKDFQKMHNSIYYQQLNSSHFSKLNISNNILKGFYAGRTVAMTMIQFAISQGTKELYLIGFDNSYKEPLGQEMEQYKISNVEQNHFHKDYRHTGDIWTNARVNDIAIQFTIIKKYCDNHNIKIYNASRQTTLDMFEKVNFDLLFLKENK